MSATNTSRHSSNANNINSKTNVTTTTNNSSTTNTTSCTDDVVYCHLLARRAVARAALHLGVDHMTHEALDSLAGCLLAYQERFGLCLAASTEAAGRSSSHVLDAIRAAELCTTTAVTAVHNNYHLGSGGDDVAVNSGTEPSTTSAVEGNDAGETPGASEAMDHSMHHGGGWKGLAAFCFGPAWMTNASKQQRQRANSATGGKVGPSSTLTDNASAATMGVAVAAANSKAGRTNMKLGWNAPYPDEVPAFPIRSQPPPMEPPALHSQPEEEEAVVPDAVFELSTEEQNDHQNDTWGELSAKRESEDVEMVEPATKKRKTVSIESPHGQPSKSSPTNLLLPTFYPPLPHQLHTRTVVAPSTTTASNPLNKVGATNTTTSSQTTVRSALALSSFDYWGSSWNTQNDDDGNSKKKETDALMVESGLPAAPTPSSAAIVPLSRASGSKVSRILEGSMDPSML